MKQPLRFDLTQASAKTVAGLSIKTWTRAAVIAGVFLALLLPLAIKGFLVFQLTLALIYAVAILGLNLLTGFNGQFSLGHSAFYGIGAYTAAILMDQADVAYYWTVPAAGAACFIVGFLFGLPALRLEGLYLVLATFGRAIMAIRDNPIAASAMGVDVALYKSLTFGVSALYTGVAGALGAIAVQFVAPDSFTFLLSVSMLVGLVIGGVASIPGSLVGGLFVLFVPNIAESISRGLAGAVYGVILLLVIYVMPSGAAGLARILTARLASIRSIRTEGRST